tara:strand:+ start:313 stop:786 length:474 start_codon:yes stop_codon:yes gene_type:complete
MHTVENVLLGEGIQDLRLELDFENIPTNDYCEIVVALKSCPSLVNDDIVSITEEIILRIESTYFRLTDDTYKMINNLHYMLHKIPNTSNLIDNLKFYCPWISKSPAVDPVSSPKIMKKPKKQGTHISDVSGRPKIMLKVKQSIIDTPLEPQSKYCPC